VVPSQTARKAVIQRSPSVHGLPGHSPSGERPGSLVSWNTGEHASLQRLVRLASVLVGLVFLGTSLAKAVDYYGFIEKAVYYRSFSYNWLHIGAWSTILGEVLLAGVFLTQVGLRRFGLLLGASVLVLFTGLILYTWARYGIDDCACLGSLAETPPHAAIAKNLILLALLGFIARHRKLLGTPTRTRVLFAGATIAIALMGVAFLILRQTEGWFA